MPCWRGIVLYGEPRPSTLPLGFKSLLGPLDSREPADTVLRLMLLAWSESGLMQREVVDSANA
jgi:hypothetical protein